MVEGTAMAHSPFGRNRAYLVVRLGLFETRLETGKGRARRCFRWDVDGLSTQTLTEDSEQAEFRALDGNRTAVQADQVFDHAAPSELRVEPFGPFGQHRQTKAHGKAIENEIRSIIIEHGSPRLSVGAERGLKQRLGQENGVSDGTLA